jgi:hypothetical protein
LGLRRGADSARGGQAAVRRRERLKESLPTTTVVRLAPVDTKFSKS